jgi:hypothetical protein
VATVELVEGHGVAGVVELGGEAPAADVDGQDLILGSVRDEDPGFPVDLDGDEEARGVGHDRAEEVAIGQAERQRIGRPVRDAADRQAVEVDVALVRHLVEDPVDELHIRAELLPGNDVPRGPP